MAQDTETVVERLRCETETVLKGPGWVTQESALCNEAASLIESQQREIAELKSDRGSVVDLLRAARSDARRKGIEEAADVAYQRAAICVDAMSQIRAGKLYRETAETSIMTENSARLEAIHIGELILALLTEEGKSE